MSSSSTRFVVVATVRFDVDSTDADRARDSVERAQNAASIASMVLTTECLVAEKKEDKPATPAGPPGGGMY